MPAPLAELVACLGLHGAIAACSCRHPGTHTVGLHSARNDVHHTAHGIRTIEQRGRTAQDFHPLGHERMVGIGHRMPIDAVVLRMPVHQHHHLARTGGDSAQHHTTRTAARHSVAHHTTAGDHQSGHLLHEAGHDGGTMPGSELFAREDAHGEGQMAGVGGLTAACHHHVGHILMERDAVGRLALGLCHRSGKQTEGEQ